MASPSALCGACGAEVPPGALRCRECGAPFAGPKRRTRIEPVVEPLPDGVGASFTTEPEPDR